MNYREEPINSTIVTEDSYANMRIGFPAHLALSFTVFHRPWTKDGGKKWRPICMDLRQQWRKPR